MKYILVFTIVSVLFACSSTPAKPEKDQQKVPETQKQNVKKKKDRDRPARLDELFERNKMSEHYEYQSEQMALVIGNLFSSAKRHAVEAYHVNDTSLRIQVYEFSDSSTVTVVDTTMGSSFDASYDRLIEITDYNGDGTADVKVVYANWEIHPGEHAYLWIYRDDRFEWIDNFRTIISPEFDPKTKKIYSYHSNGCSDMDMSFRIYQIEGNRADLVDEVDCDCCAYDHDSCDIMKKGQVVERVKLADASRFVPAYYAALVSEKCVTMMQSAEKQ